MLCAAPTVLIALANAPERDARQAPRDVRVVTAGAPPAAATIQRIEGDLGWQLTQVYGLTETAPFITVCEPIARSTLALPPDERAAHQGAARGRADHLGRAAAWSTRTASEVPHDGQTLGEIVVRGNVVMEGYYNDPEATATAIRGGWFHSGDAAVVHPDGYVEIRDRFKDVIISGGENISSVEVEGDAAAAPGRAGGRRRRRARREVGRSAARLRRAEAGRLRDGGRAARVRARPARALQGAARVHVRRASCRRRPPARSRSSCCAAAGRRSRRSRISTRKVHAHEPGPCDRSAAALSAAGAHRGRGAGMARDSLGNRENLPSSVRKT